MPENLENTSAVTKSVKLNSRDNLDVVTGRMNIFTMMKNKVQVIDFEDVLFHFDSAVFLPNGPKDASTVPDQEQIKGLRVIQCVYIYAKENSKKKMIIAGHTDRAGDDEYNFDLSLLRAQSFFYLLMCRKGDWVDTIMKKCKVEDYQQILKHFFITRLWPCDPGKVDNIHGSQTSLALKNFKIEYNLHFKRSIVEDGSINRETWEAFFDMYIWELCELMKVSDENELKAIAYQLRFCTVPDIYVGCGESMPRVDPSVNGKALQANRRVEVLFFDPGEEPVDPCQTEKDRQHTKPECPLYNEWNDIEYIPPGSVTTAVEVEVSITAIDGLYKEDGEAQGGYKSRDDRGRIYINHDHQGNWKKDVQYIDCTVSVTAKNGTLPNDAQIVWTWSDPDDLSNNDPADIALHDPDVRPEAGAEFDPNDYTGGVYATPAGNDNRGTVDTATGLRFEQIGTYTLTDSNKTAIVGGISKVRFNVTNVGGDNFILEADAAKHLRIASSVKDTTGIMTMWKRVNLEYVTMPNAKYHLKLEEMAPCFAKSYIEFRVPENPKGRKGKDITWMGETKTEAAVACNSYASHPNVGFYEHEDDPGWFLIVEANYYLKPCSASGPDPIDVQATIVSGNRVTVSKSIPFTPDLLTLFRPGNPGQSVSFQVHHWTPPVTIEVSDKLYYPNVKGGSSDEQKADPYPKNLLDHGFTTGQVVNARVSPKGFFNTRGVSLNRKVGTKYYPSGRTFVFTQVLPENVALRVICHELTHGLGFADWCGHHEYRPPKDKACRMCYRGNWLLNDDADKTLVPWDVGKYSPYACTGHTMGIREIHLEENPGLIGWK